MSAQIFLWPRITQIPPLPPNYVHVWAWDLDLSPAELDWEILSGEETNSARRFVFPRDRDRYVLAHATMRRLLAGYSGISPSQISFLSGTYGKPQIHPMHSVQPLEFNLSHSAGIAVFAVSREYKLGIDIEVLRPMEPDVAEHHFSPQELHTLQELPPEEMLPGFFRCWTSKEALLKGEGCGLNLPLAAFDVEVDPQRAPALLASRPPAEFGRNWTLIELKPTRSSVGTLAVHDGTGQFSPQAIDFFSFNR